MTLDPAPGGMPVDLLAIAQETKGFMPTDEGILLHQAARACLPLGPVLEIGTYCGKSAIYLAAAAREVGGTPSSRWTITAVRRRTSRVGSTTIRPWSTRLSV
jgi:predicted O-methyltransferase YrrM